MMSTIPILPPLGDVVTELGVFRVIFETIKHNIDSDLRVRYPLAGDFVDYYVDGLEQICTVHVDHLKNGLITMIKVSRAAIDTCADPSCGLAGRHELMEEIIKIIGTSPGAVHTELIRRGKIPGFSMN